MLRFECGLIYVSLGLKIKVGDVGNGTNSILPVN
ncbi:hypothetical protein J2T16_001458 [Paenibacillus intestini]|nr:hypothetical protein [Paenibacillus intestini]